MQHRYENMDTKNVYDYFPSYIRKKQKSKYQPGFMVIQYSISLEKGIVNDAYDVRMRYLNNFYMNKLLTFIF